MEVEWIVLGLGNPGPRYDGTRHNLGFCVVDRMAVRAGVSLAASNEFGRLTWSAAHRGVVLARPRTFMNRSGDAAHALCRGYEVEPERLLVIYDDADLDLGRLRLRHAGGAGGHNGVHSVIDALGTTGFPRLRLGVQGRERDDAALHEYVLDRFEAAERETVERLTELAADAATVAVTDGMEQAMNRFNGCDASAIDETKQTDTDGRTD